MQKINPYIPLLCFIYICLITKHFAFVVMVLIMIIILNSFVGTQTLACLTTQGDCTYRYFVGTSTSDQQPPIVFEGESKEIVYPMCTILTLNPYSLVN